MDCHILLKHCSKTDFDNNFHTSVVFGSSTSQWERNSYFHIHITLEPWILTNSNSNLPVMVVPWLFAAWAEAGEPGMVLPALCASWYGQADHGTTVPLFLCTNTQQHQVNMTGHLKGISSNYNWQRELQQTSHLRISTTCPVPSLHLVTGAEQHCGLDKGLISRQCSTQLPDF